MKRSRVIALVVAGVVAATALTFISRERKARLHEEHRGLARQAFVNSFEAEAWEGALNVDTTGGKTVDGDIVAVTVVVRSNCQAVLDLLDDYTDVPTCIAVQCIYKSGNTGWMAVSERGAFHMIHSRSDLPTSCK